MPSELPSGAAGPEQPGASRDDKALFAALYEELRRLADRELKRHEGVAVSPTTLVHEAYVNLAGRDGLAFADEGKFLGYAARAMRGLLIDFARRQQTVKRGGGYDITQLTTQHAEDEVADATELMRLSDALDALATLAPDLAELVDLKYFCGLSFVEIARVRGDSDRTIQRDWAKARLLLFRQLATDSRL